MTRSRGVIWTIGVLRTYYFKLSVISATLRWILAMSMMLSFQVGWKMRALAFSMASLAPSENGKPAKPNTIASMVRNVTHHERLGGLALAPLWR